MRFKKTVMPNVCAIFDVSTDYFVVDTTFSPSESTIYRRRPSGVIIRQCDLLSEVCPSSVCNCFGVLSHNFYDCLEHSLIELKAHSQ